MCAAKGCPGSGGYDGAGDTGQLADRQGHTTLENSMGEAAAHSPFLLIIFLIHENKQDTLVCHPVGHFGSARVGLLVVLASVRGKGG